MIRKLLQQLYLWNGLLIMASVAFLIMLSPFFTLFDNSKSHSPVIRNLSMEDSNFSKTLVNSELLRISHACCIAVVLPMVVDILMDVYLKFSVRGICIASHLFDRCCLLVSLVTPSICYLSLGKTFYFPGVYIVLFYAQFLVMATVSCKSVLVEYMEKSPVIPPCSLYLSMFTHCLKSCIRCLELLFSINFGIFGGILALITFGLTIFNLMYWTYLTRKRQHHRNCFIPTNEEYYSWIFMVALVASSFWAIVAGYIFPTKNWGEISVSLLVSYSFIQLGYIVIVTVLPGRIARMNVILTSEMLSLKQVFVRYVSHEIRSPLNVVHAGLELLLMDLRGSEVAAADRFREAVLLVEDIFAASDSAISILNDLLNYEHIDSGNFKLDMSFKPLLRIFADGEEKGPGVRCGG